MSRAATYSLTLPDWAWALIILGPFIALAGHGTVAWRAVRGFFRDVRDYVNRRVRSVEARLEAVAQYAGLDFGTLDTDASGDVRPPRGRLVDTFRDDLRGLELRVEERSQSAEARLNAGFDSRLAERIREGEGERVRALDSRFTALSEGLESTLRATLDAGLAATQKEVEARVESIRADIGGRVPVDIVGVISREFDVRVREFEGRMNAARANAASVEEAAFRRWIEEVKQEPAVQTAMKKPGNNLGPLFRIAEKHAGTKSSKAKVAMIRELLGELGVSTGTPKELAADAGMGGASPPPGAGAPPNGSGGSAPLGPDGKPQ